LSNVALHKPYLSHSTCGNHQGYMVLRTKCISWANNLSLPSPWHGDSSYISRSQPGRRGFSPYLLLTPNSRLLHTLIHPSLFLSKPPKSVHLLTCVRLHIVSRGTKPHRPHMKWQSAPPTGEQCPVGDWVETLPVV